MKQIMEMGMGRVAPTKPVKKIWDCQKRNADEKKRRK